VGARFKLGRPTARARDLRNNPTQAEKLLWSRLRKSQLGGLAFTRQLPIAGHFADFACRSAKLVVELDGSQHTKMSEADAERTRRIEAAGYRVLRFWNNQLTSNMDGVLTAILAAAFPNGKREPTPQPPPASGQGEQKKKQEGSAISTSPPASGRGPRGGRPTSSRNVGGES
jgi:very-short-patch-repair endonuclease